MVAVRAAPTEMGPPAPHKKVLPTVIVKARSFARGAWREILLASSLALALSLVLGPVAVSAPISDKTSLQVHFIDVGTGDCIWIHTGDDGVAGNGRLDGLNIIIDGGDWGRFGRVDGYDVISEYLGQSGKLPFGSTVDWLILTHPHSDHSGGLFGILRDYKVRNILDPGHDKLIDDGEPDRERLGSAYGRFFRAASEAVGPDGKKATLFWGVPPDLKLAWGSELSAQILWSSRDIVGGDLNNTSIVLRLGFAASDQPISFLFMGDAEAFVEEKLVSAFGSKLRTTVLKAGHHGSNSSTTEAFLREVRPSQIVISVGNQVFNGTMLPRPETFERIEKVSTALNLHTQVWRTDRGDKAPLLKPVGTEAGDDTVVAITDGRTLQIDYAQADVAQTLADGWCHATTKSGSQCKRRAMTGSQYCWQHRGGN